jgi:flagellar protein FlaG
MEVDMLNKTAFYAEPVNYTAYAKADVAPKKAQQSYQDYTVGGASSFYDVSDIAYEKDEYDAAEKTANNDREGRGAREMLDKAIHDANKKLIGFDRQFEYSVHEVTKDIMIKVIDTETHELIKEIPPKKVLDAIAKMWELAGILVDEKR